MSAETVFDKFRSLRRDYVAAMGATGQPTIPSVFGDYLKAANAAYAELCQHVRQGPARVILEDDQGVASEVTVGTVGCHINMTGVLYNSAPKASVTFSGLSLLDVRAIMPV